MSRLTDLRDSVLDNAAQARGQWTPDPDSRHYQLYLDFHERKHIRVPKRGRCEYFHKVIRQGFYEARWVLLSAFLVLLGAGIVYLFLKYPASMVTIAMGVVLGAYTVFGMLLTAHIAESIAPDFIGDTPLSMHWYDNLHVALQVLLAALVVPTLIVWLGMGVIIGVLFGAVWVMEYLYSLVEKPARWFFFEQPFGRRGFIWIRPWMIVAFIALVAVCIFVPGFLQSAYIPVLFGVGVLVILAGAFYAAALIDNRNRTLKRTREDSYQAVYTAHMANGAVKHLFAFQHPEWMVGGNPDAKRYASWLARYDRYCIINQSKSYDQLVFWFHMERIDAGAYYARFGESLVRLESRLNREFKQSHPHTIQQRRWYHVVVELMAVVWAAMRAAKQKVCPIVIYPPGDESA